MKQTKYNYRGSPRGSRFGQNALADYYEDQPTARQKRFVAVLRKKILEIGVDPFEGQTIPTFNRLAYKIEIERLINVCKENKISLNV